MPMRGRPEGYRVIVQGKRLEAYTIAAEAVARRVLPDFSGFTGLTIGRYFSHAFDDRGVGDPLWCKLFFGLISRFGSSVESCRLANSFVLLVNVRDAGYNRYTVAIRPSASPISYL